MFCGSQFFVNRIKNYSNKDIRDSHKVDNTVVDSFGSRSVRARFKYCTTHGALSIQIRKEDQKKSKKEYRLYSSRHNRAKSLSRLLHQ